MQSLDLGIMRVKKKLDDLPQRQRIVDLRAKKAALKEKEGQVLEMRRLAERDLSRIHDEDERLVQKQRSVQEKIDAAQGDYRSVEAHTKELGGIAKRRNTLECDLVPLDEKLGEIGKVAAQIEQALSQVDAQEGKAIASFQQEGGSLMGETAQAQKARDALYDSIGPELQKLYDKKRESSGGIAVARLEGASCSVCRTVFEEGKLLHVQGEAPLSECPNCKRILVVM